MFKIIRLKREMVYSMFERAAFEAANETFEVQNASFYACSEALET
ncbi:hypothetical protein [Candidatus Electronema sp. JM]